MSCDVTFGRLGVRALGAVLLLAACGDDAPSAPADSGNPTDVITDHGGDDVQGDDVLPDAGGPDVIDQDAGDVPAVDVIGDVPTPDAGDGGLTGLRAHTATGLVGAGGVMTSAGYRMISTLGQSTIHQGTLQSTSYRLRGGLVGASGGRGR